MQNLSHGSAEPRRQMSVPVPDRDQVKHWAIQAVTFLIVCYLIYVVREIWLPLGLSFLIATVLDPVVDRMEARGFSRAMGSAIIFTSFLLGLGVTLWFLIPAISRQGGEIQASFAKFFPDMSPKGIQASLQKLHTPAAMLGVATQALNGLRGGFERSSTWLTSYGMQFLSNLIWVVIVPIVAFYALRDFHLILGKGLLLVPKDRRGSVQTYVAEVTAIFAKYLRGLMLVSILNGIATWLLLMVCHVPNALLLGVIAGILYSVPYIGALLTIVITAGVSFIAGGPTYMAEIVGVSILLHQIIFDQIISPRILGGQVGLHPILAIVALLSGNLLLGIIGMILAVPIAACIQIGVLALIPKLGQDIAIDHNASAASESLLATEIVSREATAATDATADLHQSVQDAVDKVERQIEIDQVIADSADEVTE
ncbi:AI-2E family transporter [Fimbriimonas ginsengisoli]|nr:AI-2E family transporter [Fimbriimonas ginsengisoli]